MSGTSGSLSSRSNVLALPAPKLRMFRLPRGGVATYTLVDGNSMNSIHDLRVSLVGLPSDAFAPSHAVELRLFRYGATKSRASAPATPSRWAALPHTENGVNAYNASNWLGGVPSGALPDRHSRALVYPLSSGDSIDVLELARWWLRMVPTRAWDSATSLFTFKVIRSSWRSASNVPSRSRGVDRNVEPARFAAGFVAKDSKGKWYLASPLSTFVVRPVSQPFLLAPMHPDYIEPNPAAGVTGRRIWRYNTVYSPLEVMCRITRSEILAGA